MNLESNKRDLLDKLDRKIQGEIEDEEELEEVTNEELKKRLEDLKGELYEKKKEGDLYYLKFRDAASFTSLGG